MGSLAFEGKMMKSTAAADESACSVGDSNDARLLQLQNRALCGAGQREATPRAQLSVSRWLSRLRSELPRLASPAQQGQGVALIATDARFAHATVQSVVVG